MTFKSLFHMISKLIHQWIVDNKLNFHCAWKSAVKFKQWNHFLKLKIQSFARKFIFISSLIDFFIQIIMWTIEHKIDRLLSVAMSMSMLMAISYFQSSQQKMQCGCTLLVIAFHSLCQMKRFPRSSKRRLIYHECQSAHLSHPN